MLDDVNVLKQRDRGRALEMAARLFEQASFDVSLRDAAHDGREIKHIVIAGMGGSALAADIAKTLLAGELDLPVEVVKGYTLPHYTAHNTLLIAISHSGNTEETLGCLREARADHDDPQLAAITTGGALDKLAGEHAIMTALYPCETPARMAIIYQLKCILRVLQEYGLISGDPYDKVASLSKWLHEESDEWAKETRIEHNYAKQLALTAVGKTPVFYAGSLMAPIAYKWKVSWNENAKNVAFWNYLPESNHNEFIGWTSHPVEKPFAVFDLVSELEHPQVLKRFTVTDRLLSGRRPKATRVQLQGPTTLHQMLWGCILGDFVSIYVAILNNVDPAPVDLIEKFKKELND